MRFRHIRNMDNSPLATIASKAEGEKVTIAMARCNVGLDTFHKEKGRMISEARLKKCVAHEYHDKSDFEDALKALLDGDSVTLPKDVVGDFISQIILVMNYKNFRMHIING